MKGDFNSILRDLLCFELSLVTRLFEVVCASLWRINLDTLTALSSVAARGRPIFGKHVIWCDT